MEIGGEIGPRKHLIANVIVDIQNRRNGDWCNWLMVSPSTKKHFLINRIEFY